jgi:hypothetical protein
MCLLFILFILNALVGLFMFQWAWKEIKPLREVDEARDS